MNKRIILGTVLAIIAIATLVSLQMTTEATSPVQCNSKCSNQNCAAIQGGACDCQTCPLRQCIDGNCRGACEEPTCGAKVGGLCGCGR